MTAITSIELQGLLNHLFANGTAYNTLRGTHNTAKMLFAYAKESGLIEMNPVEETIAAIHSFPPYLPYQTPSFFER